jgi:Tfp pilus assembly protein PilF
LPEDPPWPDPVYTEWLGLAFGLQARVSLARDLLQQQQGAEAIRLLQDTVQKYPDSARAWDSLGWVLGTLGHLSEAEQAFQTSLKLAPDQGNVWFSLGLMRLRQNKFDAGLTAIHEAARLRPTDTRTHCKIGECLAGKGDREGAAAAYREALRYQPDLAEAREGLAKLQTKTRP